MINNADVYLYIPNVIDYVRLVLLVASWICFRSPAWFLGFYLTSFILDFVDGFVARKLHQTSTFGAWLDVAIDNLGRGMLWCQLYKWGYFVSAVEWCTFVCTHTAGSQWKANYGQAPWLIRNVMTDNFKSLIGMYAVLSLDLLPVWFYVCKFSYMPVPSAVQLVGIGVLSAGRAVCCVVEFYCIWAHIQQMVSSDVSQRNVSSPSTSPSEVKAES